MNKEKRYNIALPELIYLIYFVILFGAKAIGLYEGRMDYNILLAAGLFMFLVKVAVTEHSVMEYMMMGALLAVSLLVYHNTGEKGLLLYFTMMLGMKTVSLRRVMKCATIVLGSAFFVLVFLTSFGIMQDIVYVHDRKFFGQIIRHSLGYPYPNTLFTTYIILMVLILYMLGEQKLQDLLMVSLLFFIGAIYMYLYSCSNTGLIVSVFYLILNFYYQCKKRFLLVDKIIAVMAYPACLVISIICPLIVRGKAFQILDLILHNRVNYSNYYLTHEPVTLFGIRFGTPPNENYMIDSSFLYSFLQIGVIPFIIVTILMMGMIIYYVKNERKIETAIILSFCLLGLSDPFFFNLSYKNLLFLFIGDLLYRWLEKCQQGKDDFLAIKFSVFDIIREGGLDKKRVTLSSQKTPPRMIALPSGPISFCYCVAGNVKEIILEYKNWLFSLYLVCAAAICAIIYAVSFSQNVAGAIDQVEEWEYFRRVLSYGIYGSFGIIAVGVCAIMIKKKTNIRKR